MKKMLERIWFEAYTTLLLEIKHPYYTRQNKIFICILFSKYNNLSD